MLNYVAKFRVFDSDLWHRGNPIQPIIWKLGNFDPQIVGSVKNTPDLKFSAISTRESHAKCQIFATKIHADRPKSQPSQQFALAKKKRGREKINKKKKFARFAIPEDRKSFTGRNKRAKEGGATKRTASYRANWPTFESATVNFHLAGPANIPRGSFRSPDPDRKLRARYPIDSRTMQIQRRITNGRG